LTPYSLMSLALLTIAAVWFLRTLGENAQLAQKQRSQIEEREDKSLEGIKHPKEDFPDKRDAEAPEFDIS